MLLALIMYSELVCLKWVSPILRHCPGYLHERSEKTQRDCLSHGWDSNWIQYLSNTRQTTFVGGFFLILDGYYETDHLKSTDFIQSSFVKYLHEQSILDIPTELYAKLNQTFDEILEGKKLLWKRNNEMMMVSEKPVTRSNVILL
jgi:hypothetical protein